RPNPRRGRSPRRSGSEAARGRLPSLPVFRGEPGRVSRGPLHELDVAAIGILHGNDQKLGRAVGGTWLSDIHVMLTQRVHGLVHRVDLDGEVAHAVSQIDILSSGF